MTNYQGVLMPRPRRDSEILPAKERLENAFWELLSEREYNKITVTDIVRTADVNRNSFYYHFSGLPELAIPPFCTPSKTRQCRVCQGGILIPTPNGASMSPRCCVTPNSASASTDWHCWPGPAQLTGTRLVTQGIRATHHDFRTWTERRQPRSENRSHA